jgi:hypothetical protein
MQRQLMIVAMLAVLALPLMVWADETVIPPEANWSPTPPARPTVDMSQLASLLVEKGMITPQEYGQLTHPQSSSPSPQGNGRDWSWGDIDAYERSPIDSGSQGD